MPNYTTHYDFIKPTPDEFYNIEDFNKNADTLDATLRSMNINKMSTNSTPPLRNATVGSDASNASSMPWYKVASVPGALMRTNNNYNIVLNVHGVFSRSRSGKLWISCWSGSSFDTNPAVSIRWEYIWGFDPSDFLIAYNTGSFSPRVFELWCRAPIQHELYHFDVISEGEGGGTGTRNTWTLHGRIAGAAEVTPGLLKETSDIPDNPYVTGRYTGNGTSSRTISLGFTPKAIILAQNGTYSNSAGGIAITNFGADGIYSIASTGISLTAACNVNGNAYHYIAFR